MNNWSTSPLFQSPSCLHQPSYRLPNPSQTAAPLTCRGSRVRRRARAPGSRTGPGRSATWRSWLLELLPGGVDATGARARLTGRRPAAQPPFTGRRQCRRSTARGVRVPQPATATQLLAITLVRWMGVSCHWCHCHWALGVTGLSAAGFTWIVLFRHVPRQKNQGPRSSRSHVRYTFQDPGFSRFHDKHKFQDPKSTRSYNLESPRSHKYTFQNPESPRSHDKYLGMLCRIQCSQFPMSSWLTT